MKSTKQSEIFKGENSTYFTRLFDLIGMEFWCNNPTGNEIAYAYRNGAVGITTNPGYFKVLLEKEKDYVENILSISAINNKDLNYDNYTSEIIKNLVKRPLKYFYPLYKKSSGRFGRVAIQGDPLKNHSSKKMAEEAENFKKLGDNIIIKVPATTEGAEVLEQLTLQGYSTICTMSFTVSQYILMAETFERALDKNKSKNKPSCYITVLPGLLKEYFTGYIKNNKISDLDESDINIACIYTAKAAYNILKAAKYKAKIISGGARSLSDWTAMAGKDIAVTIGWDLAARLLTEEPSTKLMLDIISPADLIEKLKAKLPDFKYAIEVNNLKTDNIRNYPPFKLMQERFVNSYELLKEKIRNFF